MNPLSPQMCQLEPFSHTGEKCSPQCLSATLESFPCVIVFITYVSLYYDSQIAWPDFFIFIFFLRFSVPTAIVAFSSPYVPPRASENQSPLWFQFMHVAVSRLGCFITALNRLEVKWCYCAKRRRGCAEVQGVNLNSCLAIRGIREQVAGRHIDRN